MVPLIRVVMLESGGWGGLAHYSYNLGNALAEIDCQLTLQTRSPFELASLPRNFELCTFGADSSYADRWRAVRATLSGGEAGLLHLQSTISARRDWLHLARIRRGGVRLVVTAHNVLPHDPAERDAAGMRWAFGRIYGMSDAIIVHGEDTRDRLLDAFRLNAERITVIPHGDYGFATGSTSPRDARAALGLDDDSLVLLAFGALREYKGIPELIDAFGAIAEEFEKARLLIVGKPIRVDTDAYRRRIEQRGIADRVTLRDEYVPFEEIDRYFAACDVAVYPYRSIYQSGALQLAYGAGRPVVATRVGELTTTVRDGWNGVLAPPEDAEGLAAALRDILSRSGAERREMGERSRRLAREQHSWADAARATVNLYRAVLP